MVEQEYTGVYIGAESRTFFKAFVDRTEDYERDPSPLRIAGNTYDDEYHRPITLHGRDISLYANDNDIGHKISEQTNSKLIINHKWIHFKQRKLTIFVSNRSSKYTKQPQVINNRLNENSSPNSAKSLYVYSP